MHVVMMQAWQEAECSSNWCQAAGLNIRGMRFARDVEGQLEAAIESSRSTFFEGALQDGTIGRSQKRRRTGHSSGMHLLLCLLRPCFMMPSAVFNPFSAQLLTSLAHAIHFGPPTLLCKPH